jgi:iron complex outermembrane recepter protein
MSAATLRSMTTRFALLACACALSMAAHAWADGTREILIPAGNLREALLSLSQQSGVELVYQPDDLKPYHTKGLKGTYTAREAVILLLTGLPLELRTDPSGAMMVVVPGRDGGASAPARASAQAQDDSTKEDGKHASDPFRLAQVAQAAAAVNPGRAERADESPVVLEDIIVTAEKRNERIQDVPVPVTAITADSLIERNALRIEDYFASVPGLNLTENAYGWPVISIRGLSSLSGNPTVSVLIDDVPFGASTNIANGSYVPDVDPSDLARVEVLRGPQGTLYGASSLGGILKYVTAEPTVDRLSGTIEAGGSAVSNGYDGGYSARGSVNVPLSDTLALRASGFVRQDPGYITNLLSGQQGVNRVRAEGTFLSLRFQPFEDFSLKFSSLFQHSVADGVAYVDVGPGLHSWQQSDVAGSGKNAKTVELFSLTLSAKLAGMDFTSVSGYNVNRYRDDQDATQQLGPFTQMQFGVPGTVLPEHDHVERFTQELRLSSSIGSILDWRVGAYFDRERSFYDEDILAEVPTTGAVAGVWAQIPTPTTLTDLAGFGDLTYHFTDRFDIQLGARESHNRQTLNETITGPFAQVFIGYPTPFIRYPEVDSSDSSFTYLVTPEFKISPNMMIYARLASGFQTGGPNYNVPGVPLKYGPDTTRNYEIGFKGEVFDRTLSLDASVYLIDWRNIQISLVNPTTQESYFANGNTARSQGVELSLESRPLTGLLISLTAAYNDAKLTEALPANSTAVGADGARLPYASRISGSWSIQQDFPLGARLTGFAGATATYVGDRIGIFQGTPVRQDLPGYGKLDVRGGVRIDSWTVNVYANNVTNRQGVLEGGLDIAGMHNAFLYIQPRLIGLSVQKRF